jgi:RNA polymerase sigma-70 factor (ECF subfamily)
MLGSLQDAEDLVQETLLRAWQRLETFEGRAPFRAWLYRIATNICLDTLKGRPRRVLASAGRAPSDPSQPMPPPAVEPIWLEPYPDDLLAGVEASPEARVSLRESVTLAFLAALQLLPPRQRAVLILRDVLDWKASEVAESLGLTVPAVNSALHRARTTVAKSGITTELLSNLPAAGAIMHAQLERYMAAWENADLDALLALMLEDVTLSMPPIPASYRGQVDIRMLFGQMAFPSGAAKQWRLRSVHANGQPGFGMYQRSEDGFYQAFGIQLLQLKGELVADIITFIQPQLFSHFGLPQRLQVVRM